MAQRIGGIRRKTRHKLKKNIRDKGKLSLTRFFQTFNKGDKVQLIAEPSIQKGAYHYRFHSKHGVITGKRGRSYKVEIKDGGKIKEMFVQPVHLKRV